MGICSFGLPRLPFPLVAAEKGTAQASHCRSLDISKSMRAPLTRLARSSALVVEQQGSDGLKQECRAIDSTRLAVMPSVLALNFFL